MLKYKSDLYYIIETIWYMPMMLLGFRDQKQVVEVELMSSYSQDPVRNAIPLESKNFQTFEKQPTFGKCSFCRTLVGVVDLASRVGRVNLASSVGVVHPASPVSVVDLAAPVGVVI